MHDLGSRLTTLRLSLDARPSAHKHVSFSALERACGLVPGRWRTFERERAMTSEAASEAMEAVLRLVGALDVSPADRSSAVAFVKGERENLPWASPPEWLVNPNLRTGRGGDGVTRRRGLSKRAVERAAEADTPARFPQTAMAAFQAAFGCAAQAIKDGVPIDAAYREAAAVYLRGLAAAGVALTVGPDFWENLGYIAT